MSNLLIQVIEPAWRQKLPNFRQLAKKAVGSVLDLKKTEVSLVLANDDFVQDLNKRYRGKDKPTNVLSFESPKGCAQMAGDIVVALQTLMHESEAQHKTLEAHFAHLLIHGALHLKGYDHMNDADADDMESLEIKIMEELGYPNPYHT